MSNERAKRAAAPRSDLPLGFIDRYLSGEVLEFVETERVPVLAQATSVGLGPTGQITMTGQLPDRGWDGVLIGAGLAALDDPPAKLRQLAGLLREGGFVVLAARTGEVASAFFGGSEAGCVSVARVASAAERALGEASFQPVELYAPDPGSDGAMALAFEKRRRGPAARALGPGEAEADAIFPFACEASAAGLASEPAPGTLLVQDFAPPRNEIRRILVLKLDHFGDFVIGLPALRKLRAAYPRALIRMVVGSWNFENARASGLVDEVRSFDYFPRSALGWDGRPMQDFAAFETATEGRFDLAINLRADEDTHHLLARVDAPLRAAIGSRARFPMLDIALPYGHEERRIIAERQDIGSRLIPPDRFHSRMAHQTPFHHETPLRSAEAQSAGGHLIFGPYITLPKGRFSVAFGLSTSGYLPGLNGEMLTLDVLRDGEETVASRSYGRRGLARLTEPTEPLEFINASEIAKYEFRVELRGKPFAGRLRFQGVWLEQRERPVLPRFRPAEMHVGEQLSGLVDLIVQRTADLYEGSREWPGEVPAVLASLPGGKRRVAIAPASNSTVRDWPIASYARLVSLLTSRLDCCVLLLGSPDQAEQTGWIAGRNPGGRVLDLAGRTAWADLPGILTASDLVICNNSGIAHQAAALGCPTLAIYSGSHRPEEWGPRGVRARALMAAVPCSPCGLERVEQCPFEHHCMTAITPEQVLEQARAMMGENVRPAPSAELTAAAP